MRKCWKCNKTNTIEKKFIVGRTRTSAEDIADGKEDKNSYRRMIYCQECGYRWSPHQDNYYKHIVHNYERNAKFCDLAVRFAKSHQTVLIFAELIEHLSLLLSMTRERLIDAGLDPKICQMVNGQLEDAHNEFVKDAVKKGDIKIVVVNRVWGEGTDISSIRWVCYAKAGNPGIELEQIIGRALRRAQGKYRAGFIDSRDLFDPGFARRSRARFNYLKRKGFTPKILEQGIIQDQPKFYTLSA